MRLTRCPLSENWRSARLPKAEPAMGAGLKAVVVTKHPAWKHRLAQITITCGIPMLVLELMGVAWCDLLEAAFDMTIDHGLCRMSRAAQLPR